MTRPRTQKKNDFKRGFKTWADNTAVELRTKLGLSPHSPLCAFDLCKVLNVPVLEPSQINGITNQDLSILSTESSHWSAATIPLHEGNYLIIHNPTHSPARQQSNLMHEIAHILCEHEVSQKTIETGLSGFLRNHDEQQENEAEWLGSCLQLPRPALIWALKQQMSQTDISNHFNASEEMVRYRINITGVKAQMSKWRY